MSYILDALKKSDQERQSHRGPTIRTVHQPTRHRTGNPVVVAVLVLALALVVAAAIAAYIWISAAPADSSPPLTTPDAAPPAQAVANQSSQTGGQVQRQDVPAPAAAEPNAQTAAGPTPTVAFGELPDNVRNEIPPLTFSFHVYSDTPASRTIIINNRRVREGDQVLPHLQLLEITREGVVLKWKGHPFYINVVENW